MKRFKPSILFSILLIITISFLTSCTGSHNSPYTDGSGNLPASGVYGAILNTGKSDAIILTVDGETMVIDAGETENGDDVLAHLKSCGIDNIKYFLITHFDNDHVGGAAAVVSGTSVQNVIIPDYVRDSKNYNSFMNALSAKNIEPLTLKNDMNISLGNAVISLYPSKRTEPYTKDGDDNAFSIVSIAEYNGVRLLFAGDAESERIEELLNSGIELDCDFIKVPHHGKKDGNESLELAEAVSAKYAVITDSGGEPASEKVLKAYKDLGTEVFETKNGAVYFKIDDNGPEVLGAET